MKYNDIIKVNENFQYSVNLQFDINNISKIKEYIPTKDGCEVLKNYLNNVINSKNRATTLIGPYGKGKSHMLLVLITLLSNYSVEDSKDIDNFINKVKKVDEELYEMLAQIREAKTKLMPIIINSNYDDLNQAFLIGLSEAIERENLTDIILNTYFDIALEVISKWETEYSEVLEDLQKCLSENNCKLNELKKELKNYSKKHYEIFKNVYRCISRGQEFRPLVNTDIVKTYKDITYEICQKDYSGIFIVFDEFSKFLESANEQHIMKDLKLIQDFAELSTRTGKTEQIHLSCITHKAMNEYLKDASDIKANSFKTVEGRFKNIYFNSSMEQNYEIVSYALNKSKDFNDYYEKFYADNQKMYDEIQALSIFKNTNNVEKLLFKGCFPLNPITVYSLIELSEKIAQNERTLFTFLTDDDVYGLKYFIENNDSGLFGIEKIYDYFSTLLKKESDEHIKTIWLKSENALKKNISDDARKIIKAMSVIYMINNLEEFSATDEVIKTSLNFSSRKYNESVNELFDKSIIRRKKITEELDFATMYNRKLTKEIKDLVENKYEDLNEKDTLNEIVGKWYSIPRRYNENYKLTRFFTNIFITEEELLNMNSFNIFFEENYCDGIVLNLIKNTKEIDNIVKHFQNVADDRVVLKISKLSFTKTFSNLIKEYEAIKYLKTQNNDLADLNDELNMMQAEIVDAINDMVKEYVSDENIYECVYLDKEEKKVKYISSFISTICESVYDKTPIINNELINKRDLSAPIKKARGIVIDCVLSNDKNKITSPTSAEATIYKAIVEKENVESVRNCITLIKEFIKDSDSRKISFDTLYKTLENKPYSVRKGIIPVLLSMALKDYSDNLILYYMNREINLDSINLVKINDAPDKYYLLTEKGTSQKIQYVNDLMNIFGLTSDTDNLRINVQQVVEKMKNWILSLPRLIKESSSNEDSLIKSEFVQIKNELLKPDLNNNEFLFGKMQKVFGANNVINEMSEMKKVFDSFMDSYYKELITITKDIFNKGYKGSLSTLLQEWYAEIPDDTLKRIYDIRTKELIKYISEINTFDDNQVLNKVSKIITGFYIEDWQPSIINDYKVVLEEIKSKLETHHSDAETGQKILIINGDTTIEKNISDEENISALGNTMKNNLEEIIEEYGNSLSEQEKVNILLNIMKKFM